MTTDPQTETTEPTGRTVNDMRELYAVQHAITDAGGLLTPGVHKALDALREAWDIGVRREQAEAHQYRTALQGAARAAVAQSAPAETALRDRIAEAVIPLLLDTLPKVIAKARGYEIADVLLAAVLPPPADRPAEEAYRLAVSAALRLDTGATWEAIRDRAEDLTAEAEGLTEARRRILDQQRATGESTDLPAILRWAADHLATIANATPGEDVRQPGMQDAIDRLRWLAVEAQQQTETPCCSDPTCACVQVNAAGRCDCARWDDAPLPIRYRNWRGETADRKILPIRVWFGATDWHPEPQWFLRAVDVDRGVERDFALADMHGLPAVVPAGAGEEPADETREAEAHPPTHTWKVESPRRDKWASWGATHDERVWAAASYDDVIEVAPQRPFRLVRATTTYAVEAEHQPAAVSQPGKEN